MQPARGPLCPCKAERNLIPKWIQLILAASWDYPFSSTVNITVVANNANSEHLSHINTNSAYLRLCLHSKAVLSSHRYFISTCLKQCELFQDPWVQFYRVSSLFQLAHRQIQLKWKTFRRASRCTTCRLALFPQSRSVQQARGATLLSRRCLVKQRLWVWQGSNPQSRKIRCREQWAPNTFVTLVRVFSPPSFTADNHQ